MIGKPLVARSARANIGRTVRRTSALAPATTVAITVAITFALVAATPSGGSSLSSARPASAGQSPAGQSPAGPSAAHAAHGAAHISGQVGGPVLAVVEAQGVTWVGTGPRLEAYATCGGGATLLGRSAVLPGIVHDIAPMGGMAYLGLGADGFGVADISDPSNPRLIGHTDIHGTVRKVVVQGSYAYLVAGFGGMPIVDVVDPRAPRLVGTFDGIVSDIAVENDWAFVVARNLKLVNIEDRSAPFERSKMGEWADAVEVRDGRLYAGESDDPTRSRRQGFLRIYDVSNPNKDRPLLREIPIGDPAKDIVLDAPGQERAWVLTRSEIIEIGGVRPNPAPIIIRRRPMFEPARSIELTAGELLVTLGGGGLLGIDDTSLADRTVLAGLGSAENVVTDGRYVYVDDEGDLVRGDSIRVFDALDPYHPREIGAIAVDTAARALAIGYGVLFVGDGALVLHAYDISAGFPAPELGTIALPKKIWALAVDGHTVYVANDDRLIALDASNPRAMTVVGERRTTWGATDVALDPESPVAIVTGPDSQRETFRDTIHRIDISDPALMHQRAEARTDGWRSGIAIGGGFAFAGETALQVYDLRAPDGLADAATLEFDGDINDKALYGDHLALAVEISEGGGFLRLVDVSAPAAPVLADTLDLIDWVRDVAIDPERGLAFAAAHEAGLYVIGLEGPPDPPAPAPTPERTPFPGDIRIHLPVVAKGGLAKACPAGP